MHELITPQILMDRTADRFLVQKLPFGYDTKNGVCIYHGKNGEKCAIGQEISDTVYQDSMESNPFKPLIRKFADVAEIFDISDDNTYAFQSIQNCHDDSAAHPGLTDEEKRLYMGHRLLNSCICLGLTPSPSIVAANDAYFASAQEENDNA